MRHWKIWLYLVGMIAILASCIFVSLPGNSVLPPVASQEKVASQSSDPADTPVPVAEVIVEPTTEAVNVEAPTNEPSEAVVEAEVDYCLTCHTDKDQLILTASAEEEVPEESEGAG